MEYEEKLRNEIEKLFLNYNYSLNGNEKQKMEEMITDCKNRNLEINEVISFLEEKLKNRIKATEIRKLKTKDFFKYAEIYLGRTITSEEIIEMLNSFNLNAQELNMCVKLITDGRNDELQSIINENITIADGYIFCKKRNFTRLNNYVACNIENNNVQLHAAMYDFHPLIRDLVKEYGRNAKDEFYKIYSESVKDALEKSKIMLNNDLSLKGVSAISALVKMYPEMFSENNMKVAPVPEELASSIFKNVDPSSIWGAYITREELLDISRKY